MTAVKSSCEVERGKDCGRTVVGLDNLRRVSINGVHAQVLARQVTSRMDVGAVNNLLDVISKNFECHKVTNF
jgi:hypothetical protein